jgi:hypothetical protein
MATGSPARLSVSVSIHSFTKVAKTVPKIIMVTSSLFPLESLLSYLRRENMRHSLCTGLGHLLLVVNLLLNRHLLLDRHGLLLPLLLDRYRFHLMLFHDGRSWSSHCCPHVIGETISVHGEACFKNSQSCDVTKQEQGKYRT